MFVQSLGTCHTYNINYYISNYITMIISAEKAKHSAPLCYLHHMYSLSLYAQKKMLDDT